MTRRFLSPFVVAFCILPMAWPAGAETPPTSADADAFLADAEAELTKLWIGAERAAWVQFTVASNVP